MSCTLFEFMGYACSRSILIGMTKAICWHLLEWKVSLMICAYLSKLMKECVMIYILVTNFLSPICE